MSKFETPFPSVRYITCGLCSESLAECLWRSKHVEITAGLE